MTRERYRPTPKTRKQHLIAARQNCKLFPHKLGLRKEAIGFGQSKEKWEEWNRERSKNHRNPNLNKIWLRARFLT